jgi:acetyltransferase-like isoleucine patch superfamily enzyme
MINALQASALIPRLLRGALLRLWGVRLGSLRTVGPACWFGGRNVEIGRGSYVNFGCVFDNLAPIQIGRRCHLGMRTMLVTSTHEPGPWYGRAGAPKGRPVTVGDGCWIGAGAIIVPGVTVGDGCVIGAGAVVTQDCAPHGLYAGNPAHRVRDLKQRSTP